MNSDAPPVRVVRFGVFEADLEARELRKSGLKLRLSDQPFFLLAALLDHPGEIVTREDLRARIWPSDTFVDFDHSINAAMNKLRETLGDSAETPRYIETVPRRGYRFIAPVEVEGIVAAAGKKGPGRRRFSIISTVVLAGLAAVAIPVWFLARPRAQPGLVAVPLTTFSGFENAPSLSPDGNQVVFSWNGPKQDNVDLYVKLIGSESVLRLTHDPATETDPAWSPDGRSIAFVRHLAPNKLGVFVTPAIGGAERKLAETSACGSGGIGWHPSGRWLAISDSGSSGGGCALHALSVESGERRPLTSPPRGQGDGCPEFSADGRNLAFSRSLEWSVVSELFMLPVSDDLAARGELKQLTFTKQSSGRPRWSPDGRYLVFSTRSEASSELWRVSAFGSPIPERLAFAGAQGDSPAISSRGNRLVFVRGQFDRNVWRLNVPGRNRKAGAPAPLISSTATDGSPQYSPDGRRIVFISSRSGSNEVWVCSADGSNEVRLTSMNAAMSGAPRWSPDGRRIVFDSTASGNFDVYVIDSDGGRPRRLTDQPSSDAVASWSSDGRYIYFFSDRSGRSEVWRMPAKGGEVVQITKNGGYVAFESMDGRSLYFSKRLYLSSLWRLDFGTGEERQILESVLGFQFAVTAKGIYYEQPEPGGTASIRYLNFRNGRERKLAFTERPSVFGFSVSPDERHIVYSQIDLAGSDLMLVENFR